MGWEVRFAGYDERRHVAGVWYNTNMKNKWFLKPAVLVVVLAVSFVADSAWAGYVKGYYRKNGTYVHGYYRGGSSSKSSSYSHKSSSSKSYGGSSSFSGGSSAIYGGGSTTYATTPTRYKDPDETTASATVSESTESAWTRSRMEKIETELEAYRTRHDGKIPKTLQILWRSSTTTFSTTDGWGSKFQFDSDGDKYILISKGPDKKLGTDDDVRSSGSSAQLSDSGK